MKVVIIARFLGKFGDKIELEPVVTPAMAERMRREAEADDSTGKELNALRDGRHRPTNPSGQN